MFRAGYSKGMYYSETGLIFKKDGSRAKITPHDKPVELKKNGATDLLEAAEILATQNWERKVRREGYHESETEPTLDGVAEWRELHDPVHYPAVSKKWEDCLETHASDLGCSEDDPWYAQAKVNGDRQMAWRAATDSETRHTGESRSAERHDHADTDVVLYARKVKEVPFRDAIRQQCGLIFDYIEKTWPELGDVGLDGEVYAPGLSHQDARSLLGHKKTKSPDEHKLVFLIFDIMEYTLPFTKRSAIVDAISDHFLSRGTSRSGVPGTSRLLPNIAFLGTSVLTQDEDIQSYNEMCEEAGFDEGIILRRGDLMYTKKKEHKHCAMVKVKNWNDEEYEVIGFKEGEGSREGCVVWHLRLKDGTEFWCSMKGDVPTLKWYYQHGEEYIGRMATVRYTELTNDGIPKMAFVTHFRDEDDLPPR